MPAARLLLVAALIALLAAGTSGAAARKDGLPSYVTGYALDHLAWSPRALAFVLGMAFCVPGVLWLVMNARWKPSARLETPDPVHSGEEEALEWRVG